jgi:hypothetical protein
MPIHDWTRVEPAVFCDFRHSWLSEIKRALNCLFQSRYYALVQRKDLPIYTRRHQNSSSRFPSDVIVVCREADDQAVGIIEILMVQDKHNTEEKACELLERKIHLLVIDPFPSCEPDSRGSCAVTWERMDDAVNDRPSEERNRIEADEFDAHVRGYIESLAVGDELPDMPLFLEPEAYIDVPLERTYMAAWEAVPLRWRRVIEASPI